MMDRMPQEPQSGDAVLTFGEPARRNLLRDLGTDRRLPILTAALGAVAAFGSLTSEWQITTLDETVIGTAATAGGRILSAGLIDLGAAGAGYLVGLLLLTTAAVLVLCGPPAGRRHARLAGLAVGGVLLALLLALMGTLSETSLLLPRYFTLELSGDEVRVSPGRGLWCAIAGAGLALTALCLPATGKAPATVAPEPETTDDPLDLTISPAAPFAPFPDSLPGAVDRPHRS